MKVFKDFTFEAAHSLPHLPETHKCHYTHGHSYRVRVQVEGEIRENFWVIDYDDISKAFQPIIDQYLDHKHLNDIPGLSASTSEMLALWIWSRLVAVLPTDLGLTIVVYETPTAGCLYDGQ